VTAEYIVFGWMCWLVLNIEWTRLNKMFLIISLMWSIMQCDSAGRNVYPVIWA